MKYFLLFFIFFSNQVFAKNENFLVAKVNNHIITNYDLQDRYNFLLAFSKIKINSEFEKKIFLNQIIDKLIDEELIINEAKNLGISTSIEEINSLIEEFAKKRGQNFSSFKNFFTSRDISFQNYQKQIEADLLWSKIISSSLKSKIKITDLQIQEFLEQQKLDINVTKYKISEIYISNKNDAKIFIEKLHQDLENGANFEDFVKQFSQSPTSDNNGEIGWVSKSDINSEIYNAISKMSKNSYSKPIFLADGYYIFKVLDKKNTTEIKENDLSFAKNRIFMQSLEIEGKSYLMNMRKKSFIEVYRTKI